MMKTTESGQYWHLSADEERFWVEARGSVGRNDGEGRLARLLLDVLATLDRERAEHERLAADIEHLKTELERARKPVIGITGYWKTDQEPPEYPKEQSDA